MHVLFDLNKRKMNNFNHLRKLRHKKQSSYCLKVSVLCFVFNNKFTIKKLELEALCSFVLRGNSFYFLPTCF